MPVMKRIQKPSDDPDSMWHDVALDESVYVCYGPVEGTKAIMVNTDSKSNTKTLYVFKSLDAVKRYVQSMGNKFFYGEVALGFLISNLRSVYAAEHDFQVKCVLTSLERDGILYELDVLWQLLTH